VETFVATASVLEGVGVTAYLGAAASIVSGAYLTAAGSILTVEARHSAYLRNALKERPYPQAFDAPLDFNEVYTLAAPFIVSCPSTNPTFLPLKAFPAITVKSTSPVLTGSTISVYANLSAWGSGPVYAAFISVTGPVFATITPTAQYTWNVVIPAGIHGQSYLVLTDSATAATDDSIVAGPAIVEVSGTDGFPTVV
jgi:Ferritin-like domain